MSRDKILKYTVLIAIVLLIIVQFGLPKLNNYIDNSALSEIDSIPISINEEFENKIDQIKLACENKDASACYKIASFYQYGIQDVEYLQKSIDYYQKACDLENKEACTRADIMQKKLDAYIKNSEQLKADLEKISHSADVKNIFQASNAIEEISEDECSEDNIYACQKVDSIVWYRKVEI